MSMIGIGNRRNVTRAILWDRDGNQIGTVSVTRKVQTNKKEEKKQKKLQYNFRRVSSQILRAKTSGTAGMAVKQAIYQVVLLLRKQASGEYDENELRRALTHANRIKRVAKKKEKHLKEEEQAKSGMEREEFEELQEPEKTAELSDDRLQEEMQKELEEMLTSMEDITDELMESLEAALEEMVGLEELNEEVMGDVFGDMSPEDLETLKKKHRAKELREITEADMKYLKSKFQSLQNERDSAKYGVMLELMGEKISVEQMITVPPESVGGCIDMQA